MHCLPDDADVVIANGYPFDTLFYFMRKAYKPLDLAPRNSTKVMIASNHEGIGTHGLFQHMKPPRLMKYRVLYRHVSMMEPKAVMSKLLKRLTLQRKAKVSTSSRNYALPKDTAHLWVYSPNRNAVWNHTPEGITVVPTWDDILNAIKREQASKRNIKVRIYPCAPLQCLDTPAESTKDLTE